MAKLQSPLTVQENFQNSDLLKHTHMCVCVYIYSDWLHESISLGAVFRNEQVKIYIQNYIRYG